MCCYPSALPGLSTLSIAGTVTLEIFCLFSRDLVGALAFLACLGPLDFLE